MLFYFYPDNPFPSFVATPDNWLKWREGNCSVIRLFLLFLDLQSPHPKIILNIYQMLIVNAAVCDHGYFLFIFYLAI